MSAGLIVENAPVETAPVKTREFSYHDRCDRCGFQSYFVCINEFEGIEDVELTFCKHHGEEHTPVMELQGWTVFDFTDRLYEEDRLTGSEN